MRFIKACLGEAVDTTPVWLMRQAGRYLPEYQELRRQADFWTICHTPGLAALATLQPMERYDLDAAIIFSDILIPVEAMGVPVEFEPAPRLPAPIRTRGQAMSLRSPDPATATGFVLEAMAKVRARLDQGKALIGFAGAPFTVVAYMVEGEGARDFIQLKTLMYRDPLLIEDLLARVSAFTAAYLSAQIDAGANAVQLFDSWAGILSPEDYRHFALPWARQVVRQARRPGVPVIYFMNGVGGVAEVLSEIGADVIGVDHRVSLADAIRRIGPNTVVQGNLDPGVLLGPGGLVRARAFEVVQAGMGAKGHIFNLGHGVHKDTPVESVGVLVEAVHESGRRGQ